MNWPVQCATCQGGFLSHDVVCWALLHSLSAYKHLAFPRKLQALGSQLVGQIKLQATPLNIQGLLGPLHAVHP